MTYDYECKKCQHRFEADQSIKDEPLKKCPKCSGPVVRVITACNFVLKGTGWSNTGFVSMGELSKANDKLVKDNEHSKRPR